jgi:uncharacterized protein
VTATGASTRKQTGTPARAGATSTATKAARRAAAAKRRHAELHVRAGSDPEAARRPAAADGVHLPKIAKRRSSVSGWGVYAQERIPKNKRIVAYTGEKIDHKESLRREAKYLESGEIWCFKLNNRWVIDASVGGNHARFINHACKPNCYTQIIGGTIWVRAGRTIAAGEELTYNYYTEGDAEIPCTCRPGCKGML